MNMTGALIIKHFGWLRHGLRVRLNAGFHFLQLLAIKVRLKISAPHGRLVFITLLESLGDIVACEPIVREIKRRDPRCYVVWGVKAAFMELVESNPCIERTIVLHCLSERILLARKGLFDQVVDLHFSDRHCSLCRKPLLPATKTAHAISLGNYFNFGNILDTFSQSAGLEVPDLTPRVYIPAASAARVDRLNLRSPYVVIHCMSNAWEKDWPVTKWRDLHAALSSAGYEISVVEVGTASIFGDDPPSGLASLCGVLSILESAEVIRRASLFIGIDSGPAHLANAVGTYGVILLGSYLGFGRYTPFSGKYANGENATLIHADGLVADIAVEDVFRAVAGYLAAGGTACASQ